MNKSTDVVHRGWMTKSPPEQKLQSALKIFRAVSFRLPFKITSDWLQTSLCLTSCSLETVLCEQSDSILAYVFETGVSLTETCTAV